jgi:hypothetical protein
MRMAGSIRARTLFLLSVSVRINVSLARTTLTQAQSSSGAAQGEAYAWDLTFLYSYAGIPARRLRIISVALVLFRCSTGSEKPVSAKIIKTYLGE